MIWLGEAAVFAIHEEQIAEHGGAPGLRDAGLLQYALARPINVLEYSDVDVAGLAAAYAFAICQNHPFVDGNKRVSLIAAETFLALNGHELVAPDHDVLKTWLALASGSLRETELADWMRANTVRLSAN